VVRKLKIAVLLPGHIRAWDYCKQNFMDTIYDNTHQIDVFIDTYNDIFRNDYQLHKENEMGIIKDDSEVLSLFEGINVVDFKIENQIPGDAEQMQIRKILKNVETYENYEQMNGLYDLVIKSRCDILLDEKLDYEEIHRNCVESRLIYIGTGAVHMRENDMFAICNSETFKFYGKRFLDFPTIHRSMNEIELKYNVSYSQTIGISIVRLDGNKNYTVFK
jgi:hypothetical protein